MIYLILTAGAGATAMMFYLNWALAQYKGPSVYTDWSSVVEQLLGPEANLFATSVEINGRAWPAALIFIVTLALVAWQFPGRKRIGVVAIILMLTWIAAATTPFGAAVAALIYAGAWQLLGLMFQSWLAVVLFLAALAVVGWSFGWMPSWAKVKAFWATTKPTAPATTTTSAQPKLADRLMEKATAFNQQRKTAKASRLAEAAAAAEARTAANATRQAELDAELAPLRAAAAAEIEAMHALAKAEREALLAQAKADSDAFLTDMKRQLDEATATLTAAKAEVPTAPSPAPQESAPAVTSLVPPKDEEAKTKPWASVEEFRQILEELHASVTETLKAKEPPEAQVPAAPPARQPWQASPIGSQTFLGGIPAQVTVQWNGGMVATPPAVAPAPPAPAAPVTPPTPAPTPTPAPVGSFTLAVAIRILGGGDKSKLRTGLRMLQERGVSLATVTEFNSLVNGRGAYTPATTATVTDAFNLLRADQKARLKEGLMALKTAGATLPPDYEPLTL